jgi:hypothetical protein
MSSITLLYLVLRHRDNSLYPLLHGLLVLFTFSLVAKVIYNISVGTFAGVEVSNCLTT